MTPQHTPIRACVFDFDGTLVDSMGGFTELAGELIAAHYHTSVTAGQEAYVRTSGLPFRQQLEALYPGDERNDEVARVFEARKLAGFFARQYFPEVPDVMRQLRDAGLVLAVSSNNGQDNVDRFVAARGVRYDQVLGWRPGFSKGVDHYDQVCRAAGLTVTDLLVVGDSLHDAETARDYGARFVARAGTFPAAAFHERWPDLTVVQTLRELPALLHGGDAR
jgi:phosphoglycolate phosphatase-like HAD superfamily hydrolase